MIVVLTLIGHRLRGRRSPWPPPFQVEQSTSRVRPLGITINRIRSSLEALPPGRVLPPARRIQGRPAALAEHPDDGVALRRLPSVAFYGPSATARRGSISSVLTERRQRLQTLHAVVIAGWIGGV